MTTTLSPYKDPGILNTIYGWWNKNYGYSADKDGAPGQSKPGLTILDLYQSYCEYTLDRKKWMERLEANQFAKCLMAAKILEIDGHWIMDKDWEPREYEIRRAITNPSYNDTIAFVEQN